MAPAPSLVRVRSPIDTDLPAQAADVAALGGRARAAKALVR
jgi:hypothetical protein